MKNISLTFFILITFGLYSQTVSTLVPTNVGDDLHFGADGNIYSSHYGGRNFRKINPATGSVDTILTVNTLTIGAIEMDDSLKIYTSSYDNGWVGKFVEGDNAITTIATGLSGPAGITHDNNGNLYVATNANHRIIKITPEGQQSIFASGDPLFWPTGITIDPEGTLYVANMFNGKIIKITQEQEVSVLATLPANSNQVPDLAYLTWTNEKLYVCHYENHQIYEVDPFNGDHEIIGGTGQAGHENGLANMATFEHPTGIVASPTGDSLFITDGDAPIQRLRMIVLDAVSPSSEIKPIRLEVRNLFPNPTRDTLNVELDSRNAQTFNFQISDTTGRQIFQNQQYDLKQGYNRLEFAAADLVAGLYFLKITGRGFQKTITFAKS